MVRSVAFMTLKIPGQDPPERQFQPGDTVPSAHLFWLSLLNVCRRPTWVACALSGPLVLPKGWVACECVRAEGMEDAGTVKGVEKKVVSCHKSIVLGIKWLGQVV